jgi:hypothetical protein
LLPSTREGVMVHERELAALQAVQPEQLQTDGRWPVPYAIMFITVVSVGLWSLIITLASWLVG